MNNFYGEKQQQWQQAGQALAPELYHSVVEPVSLIECVADPSVWQGVRIQTLAPASEAYNKWDNWTRKVRFDFGRHLVGRVEIVLENDQCNDAPVRVKCKFAETPYEFSVNFSDYKGHLDISWMQEEVRIFDSLPEVIKLDRRFAFRYMELEFGSPNYHTRIKSVRAIAETYAGEALPAPADLTEKEKRIDQVSLATMSGCMQSIFEDGPKRDRRLWLGDLWLQAKINATTFRQFDLVERCAYLLASVCDEKGEVPGSMYVWGDFFEASCKVMTYALLFGPLLADHLDFSGREEICRELLPVVLRQHEIFRDYIDEKGVLHPAEKWWLFVDHEPRLCRETPAMGIYVYSLRRTAEMMQKLQIDGYAELLAEADRISALLRERLWDGERKLMKSDNGQFSFATQAWMILAGVATAEQAKLMWQSLWSDPEILRPRTPYLWSTVMEAGLAIGEEAKVREFIVEYWGGMVDRGADTFWEVYDPAEPLYSSYGDAMMNSACHAWSCFPGYLLRFGKI